MSDRTFSFRMDDFDKNIRKTWQEIQGNADFCDMTLACEDQMVEAHKLIISSRSPILKNILKLKSNNKFPVIYLMGIKFRDLINLLKFMYQGEVNIPQEELNSFFTVANNLKITGIYKGESKDIASKIVSITSLMMSKISSLVVSS